MSLAMISNGTLLKRSTDGSSFSTVPECARVTSPDVRVDLQDVTSHDSSGGFREYIPGLKDGDTVPAELFVVINNAIHVGIREDAYAATKREYNITFAGGSGADEDVVTFECYVASFPWMANVGEVFKSTLSLKSTGLPVWSAT